MKSFQQYQMSDRLLIKARIKSDLTYLFYISTSSVGARESMKPVADPRAAQFQPTPVCLFFPLHRTTLPHPLLSLTYRYTHTLSSHRFNPPRSISVVVLYPRGFGPLQPDSSISQGSKSYRFYEPPRRACTRCAHRAQLLFSRVHSHARFHTRCVLVVPITRTRERVQLHR